MMDHFNLLFVSEKSPNTLEKAALVRFKPIKDYSRLTVNRILPYLLDCMGILDNDYTVYVVYRGIVFWYVPKVGCLEATIVKDYVEGINLNSYCFDV